MTNPDVRLNKIPIKLFLDALKDLYDEGARFFDILGVNNEEQDVIGIAIHKDYMLKEGEKDDDNEDAIEEEDVDEQENEIITNIKLSDEDLNQLL